MAQLEGDPEGEAIGEGQGDLGIKTQVRSLVPSWGERGGALQIKDIGRVLIWERSQVC